MNEKPINEMVMDNIVQYGLMVNSGRMLPKLTDGLKPVQRRILYVMRGYRKFTKSAKIVGDVMGNYHPHGDMSIYDAMTRMTQDFVSFCPPVEGAGSWGTIDGDGAAAMRYTEARINNIGLSFLNLVDDGTVDFVPNFDNSLSEPVELPVPFPNVFVAGSQSIAVGFAGRIPTHHPADVCRAAREKIISPEMTDDRLFELMPPCYPNGGIITNTAGVRRAYREGSGSITLAAYIEIVPNGLQISNIPYYTTTGDVVESIRQAATGKDPKIASINEIQIVGDGVVLVGLIRGSDAAKVTRQLYRHTHCMRTLPLSFTVLNSRGEICPSYPALRIMSEWIWWYYTVLIRMHRHRHETISHTIHVQSGVAAILRYGAKKFANILTSCATEDEARTRIHNELQLDEIQIDHVLKLPTRSLIKMNLDNLMATIEKNMGTRDYHGEMLRDPSKISREMIDGLDRWIEWFDRHVPRPDRMLLQEWTGLQNNQEVDYEDALVMLTRQGYIRRIQADLSSQKRGGRGVMVGRMTQDDAPAQIIHTNTHEVLMFLTSAGRLFVKPVYELPVTSKNTKALPIDTIISLRENETICTILSVARDWYAREHDYLVMCTANGIVKKTSVSEFANVNASGIRAISFGQSDYLVGAEILEKDSNNRTIMITTIGSVNYTGACAIRFDHEEIRATSRSASGVIGINLNGQDRDDRVGSMFLAPCESDDLLVMTVSSDGYSKLTPLNEYSLQSRGGKGRILAGKRIGTYISSARLVSNDDAAIVVSNQRMITTQVSQLNVQARKTLGVRIMNIDPNTEHVVYFTTYRETL